MSDKDKCPKCPECGSVLEFYCPAKPASDTDLGWRCIRPDCHYKESVADRFDDLYEELAQAKADNAELLALLRECEWAADPDGLDSAICPSCRCYQNPDGEGHAPDCKLKAALEKPQ